MKFSLITLITALAASTIATPLPLSDSPNSISTLQESSLPYDDTPLPFDLEDRSLPLETRALTRKQCKKACDKGADAVEAFCRRVPKLDLRVRAACWAASTAAQSPLGQRACVAFCDAWF